MAHLTVRRINIIGAKSLKMIVPAVSEGLSDNPPKSPWRWSFKS